MTDRLSELLGGDDARPYRHAHDGSDDDVEHGESPDGATADDTSFVDDDEDLKLPPRRRVAPLTMVLCALLLAALAFGAGVLMQKHHDRGLSRSASGGFPSLPGGAGGGAFPGLPGAGGSATGAGTGNQGSGQDGTATASPVVIGTVVSTAATSATVKDLGGTKHVVHLTKDTTITAPINHTKLRVGATVSVYGTETSGAVSATNITIR